MFSDFFYILKDEYAYIFLGILQPYYCLFDRGKRRGWRFFPFPFWMMTHFHLLKGKKSHVLTKT